MKKTTPVLILLLILGLSLNVRSAETIRIAVFSQKNFGDTKANDTPRLDFIADRIAEQASKGLCVVDELQDVDGSALVKLTQAVSASAHITIAAAFSERVGGSKKEQFGFFWNPALMSQVGEVQTIRFDEIERDPGVATFKCTEGFDFTICVFHTRPNGVELKDELSALDEVFKHIQDMDTNENDIIFAGDFNAPPVAKSEFHQDFGITEQMDTSGLSLKFAVEHKPTNVLQNKLFDNIFFDAAETTEFVDGPDHVVPMFEMLDEFTGEIPDADEIGWFRKNVADHCPIYAVFRADQDTD